MVSVGYSAPEGASTSVPIEQLIAASGTGAERVRGTSPTGNEGPASRVDINVPSASPDSDESCTLYDDRPAPPELLFEGEPVEAVLPALDGWSSTRRNCSQSPRSVLPLARRTHFGVCRRRKPN